MTKCLYLLESFAHNAIITPNTTLATKVASPNPEAPTRPPTAALCFVAALAVEDDADDDDDAPSALRRLWVSKVGSGAGEPERTG